MNKSILSNPAFRYIFEIFIIVFSVTISFYIQDVLNEKDRIEIKNKVLSLSKIKNLERIENTIKTDLSNATGMEIKLKITPLPELEEIRIETFSGECLDSIDAVIEEYQEAVDSPVRAYEGVAATEQRS